MSDHFDHLHLKRNTKGSSNELSFDVLDAARTDEDSKSSKPGRFSQPSKGSYHGVNGVSSLSGQAAVEQKRRKRKMRNSIRYLLTALCVLLVVGVIGFVLYQQYTKFQTFDQQFDTLIAQFVEEDEFLAELDELVGGRASAANQEKLKSAQARMPEVIASMEGIKAGAEQLVTLAVSEKDKVAANQMVVAAESRLKMLSYAEQVLNIEVVMSAENESLNIIWNDVLDADQQAREATDMANKATTEELTQEAREATENAMGSLVAVRESIQSFEVDHPTISMAAQVEYLDKRVNSMEYALATADALLEGDVDKAAAQNELYNKADQEAVKLAEALPRSVEDVVEKAHAKDLKKVRAAYNEARDKTIEADTVVREYISS